MKNLIGERAAARAGSMRKILNYTGATSLLQGRSAYFLFLYSVGEYPVHFLNMRLK